jgi:hypothetical protein
MVIDAREIVGSGFPPDEGERLADWFLTHDDRISGEEVDLTKCPSALLISAFFNAFLQRIYERRQDLYPDAKSLRWKLKFDFQDKNVQDWIDNFKPAEQGGSKS